MTAWPRPSCPPPDLVVMKHPWRRRVCEHFPPRPCSPNPPLNPTVTTHLHVPLLTHLCLGALLFDLVLHARLPDSVGSFYCGFQFYYANPTLFNVPSALLHACVFYLLRIHIFLNVISCSCRICSRRSVVLLEIRRNYLTVCPTHL